MESDQPTTVRLARGCRVRADAELAERCAAVLVGCPSETVIVGLTAARLHELWLPDMPDEIEVATYTPPRQPHQMARTKRTEIRSHRRAIAAEEVMLLNGLPVTTMARTVRDLAARLPLADVVAAGDSAVRAGMAADELVLVVSRGKRARGIVRAREAAALLDGSSRSRPESHLRVAVSRLRLAFEVKKPIHRRDGGWLAEPDLSLRDAKLALEYQGSDHAELIRMRRDLTRFADMRHEGWLVLPYGPAEVFGRPWQIASEVRAAVRARAPDLLS